MDYETLKQFLTTAGVNLLFGIIILIVGLFIVNWVVKFLRKSNVFTKLEPSLQSFFLNTIKLILTVIVVLSAANVIGVPLTSIITIFASAGVAVSLGMQGALGNLVGGITLLILKPIKVGEFVRIGDHVGFVKTIGAFYTEIKTKDATLISLPNSALTNTAIINYTREGNRRVQVSFQVAYGSDIDTVKRVLKEVADGFDLVLADPPSKVVLDKLNNSSMEFEVRAWTPAANYSKVLKYITEAGKKALDAEGIHIPFQQMDVHIKQ
ncbi:MAG: mechanosensitive ion channel family protein [Firmicutes bacterium]|nr:mechanosensitive ion channel family protein [Bacillota bacterium]